MAMAMLNHCKTDIFAVNHLYLYTLKYMVSGLIGFQNLVAADKQGLN